MSEWRPDKHRQNCQKLLIGKSSRQGQCAPRRDSDAAFEMLMRQ